MPAKPPTPESPHPPQIVSLFAGLFGAFLGLTLLKFGNPILMERMITWPANFWEWLVAGWPVVIGYGLLTGVAVFGLAIAGWKVAVPRWLIVLPLVWFAWEIFAAIQSKYPQVSWPTVGHFLTCLVCFYLGVFCLSRVERLRWFWFFLIASFFIVLALGFQQHFGGLEETRRYWLLYEYPKLPEVDPTFYKKMTSNRIFSTLFYPNTLAGVILLLLPVTLAVFWSAREMFSPGARRFLLGVAAAVALACLFWSGSKGGWLLMLVIGFLAVLHFPIPRKLKTGLVIAVVVFGLAGFFLKYAGFFRKGATSVVERFHYWEAAVKMVRTNPVFGSGPGTFGKVYQRIKPPEWEMAMLTHNDYLEQASDSGLPGFLAFGVWVVGSLIYIWRKGGLQSDWVRLAVWLGLLGWALQGVMEFGLYIPAVSWTAFTLLGWLVGTTVASPDASLGDRDGVERRPSSSL